MKPFATWRIADQSLLYNCLDLAQEADYERVRFHCALDVNLTASDLERSTLWTVKTEIVRGGSDPGPGEDTVCINEFAASGKPADPKSGWDLIHHHWQLTCERLDLIWDNFVPGTPNSQVGRFSRIDPAAILIPPYWIGENVQVGAGAIVGPFSSIGDDSVVGDGTFVESTHVEEGTYLGEDATFDSHFVGDDTLLSRSRYVRHRSVDPLIVDRTGLRADSSRQRDGEQLLV